MAPKVTNKVASPVEEERNKRLAKTLIKNLQRRHIEGFYCRLSCNSPWMS